MSRAKHCIRCTVFILVALVTAKAWGAAFTSGNLVVVQSGDGSAALSSASTAAFLKEFTIAGSPVQTIALPTAISGSNQPLTLAGSSATEGFLALSVNKQFLTLAGYATPPGTASVAGTTASTVNRVVGVVNQAGAIDTTTALNNNNTGANVRSAVSTNGTDLWVGGGGTSPAYTTKGSTTAVALNTSTNGPANERAIDIFSGQLYEAAATGTFQGMVSVGTGIPTTNGQVATLLPGFPNTAGPGPNDFFFADASDIYVTDDRSTGTGGGLQKWHLSAGTWALLYTLTNGITTGLHGLTGVDDGSGNAILYATTGETSANKLVTITDLISATSLPGAEAFTTLATAPTNTAFRGVDFAPIPEPASIGILAVTIGSILTARRRRA